MLPSYSTSRMYSKISLLRYPLFLLKYSLNSSVKRKYTAKETLAVLFHIHRVLHGFFYPSYFLGKTMSMPPLSFNSLSCGMGGGDWGHIGPCSLLRMRAVGHIQPHHLKIPNITFILLDNACTALAHPSPHANHLDLSGPIRLCIPSKTYT